MSILADTAKRLSKGELFQIEKSRKLDITEVEYFKMISDKTAALISACCELGAITVSDSIEEREQLKKFGENLGIAFQIKDDLLDFQGNQIILGKPVGADLKEKKITLPLILSFKNSPENEKKFILKLIKKGVTQKDISQIYRFIQLYGGLQYAREYAQSYADKAKRMLDPIQNEYAKKNALNFVDYVINRKK